MTIFLFILGFIALIKGADYLVDGSASIAKKFNISNIVIGLTIVAFGTSAPELIVNILASMKGSSDLAISNIIGSNIANIFLILGVTSLIYPLKVKSNSVWKEIPLSLLSVVLLFFMVNDVMFDGAAVNSLTRIDGVCLLAFFIIFMYYSFGMAKSGVDGESEKVEELSSAKSTVYVLLGLVGLAIGGKWIVDGAIYIASMFNMPESVVGLTVVAIGTSLPELATSVTAAMKHNADIAVGNTVGSNIFNVFWILGLSSLVAPIPFAGGASQYDLMVAIIASFLLFAFMFFGKKHVLQRSQGALFLVIYFGYMTYTVINAI
ncbi:calcium/sodium antiporter [bacterium]|jgi:cation:H+ antiporter|nr:calcium/sodium antiporter [bacterium]MBT6294048.1 calcium/sodium antiporter [bacterium]